MPKVQREARHRPLCYAAFLEREMETFKQYERRIKKLEKKVLAMTDKAMTDQAGLKAVMEEIGQLNIKSGSRVDVMQAIADRVIAPAGIRYLAIDGPIAGMASLVPVGATRPMN